jgi:hypothetical protein
LSGAFLRLFVWFVCFDGRVRGEAKRNEICTVQRTRPS